MERRPIHVLANTVLRQQVLPVMRNEEVVKSITNDELIILFGNELCDKFIASNHHDMIRARLSMLGRFKCAMRNINEEIDDFASILNPQYLDSAVLVVKKCGKFDAVTEKNDSPTTAFALCNLLKQCISYRKNQCLREQDYEGAKVADEFLALLEGNQEFCTALENQE